MTAKVVQTADLLPEGNTVPSAVKTPSTPMEESQVDVQENKSEIGSKERESAENQNQDTSTCSPGPLHDEQDIADGGTSQKYHPVLLEAAPLCQSKDDALPIGHSVSLHGPSNNDQLVTEPAPLSQSNDEVAHMCKVSPLALDEPNEEDHSVVEPAPLSQSNDEAAGMSKVSPPALDEPNEKDHSVVEPAPLSQSNDEAAGMSKVSPPTLDEPNEMDHFVVEPAPLSQSNDEAAGMSKVSPPALDEPNLKGHSVVEPAPLSKSNDEAAGMSKVSPPTLDEPNEEDHSVIEPAPLSQSNDEAAGMSKVSPPALDEPNEKGHSVFEPAPLSQSNDEAAGMSKVSPPTLDEPNERNHSVIEPAPLSQSNDEAAGMSKVSPPALDKPNEKGHSVVEPAPLSQSNDEAAGMSKVSPPTLDEPNEKGHSVVEPAPLSQSNDEAAGMSKVSPPTLDEPNERNHSVIEPAPLSQSNDEAAGMSKVSPPTLDKPNEKDHSVVEPAPLSQSNDEAAHMSKVSPPALDEPNEKGYSVAEPPLAKSSDEAALVSDGKPVSFDSPLETDSPDSEAVSLQQCTDDSICRKAQHLALIPFKGETERDKGSLMFKGKDDNLSITGEDHQLVSYREENEVGQSIIVNHALANQTLPSSLCKGGTVIAKAKHCMSLDLYKQSGEDSLSSAASNETTGQSFAIGDTTIQPLPIDKNKDQKSLVGPQPVFTDYRAAIKRLFALPTPKPGSSKPIENPTPVVTRDPVDDEPLFLDYQKKWKTNDKYESKGGDCNITADEMITNLFKDDSDFSLASIPDSREDSPLPTARQSQMQSPNDMNEDALDDVLLSTDNNGKNIEAAMENEQGIPPPTNASNLHVPEKSSPALDCNDEVVPIKPEGMEHEVSPKQTERQHLNNGPVPMESEETRSAPLESIKENRSNSNVIKIPCCTCTEEECETGSHEKQMLSSDDKRSELQYKRGDFQRPNGNQDVVEKETLETNQPCAVLSIITPTTDPNNMLSSVTADECLPVSQDPGGPTCQINSQLTLENGSSLQGNDLGSPRITCSTPPSITEAVHASEARTICQNQTVPGNWSLPNIPLPDYEEEMLGMNDDETSQFDPYPQLSRGEYTSTPIPKLESEDEDPYGQLERRRYNSTPIPMLECEVEDRFNQLQRRYQNSAHARMIENEDENIPNKPPRPSWMQHPDSPDMVSTAHSYTAIMPFRNAAQDDDTSREEATGQGMISFNLLPIVCSLLYALPVHSASSRSSYDVRAPWQRGWVSFQ